MFTPISAPSTFELKSEDYTYFEPVEIRILQAEEPGRRFLDMFWH
jgi:hypothetical protein